MEHQTEKKKTLLNLLCYLKNYVVMHFSIYRVLHYQTDKIAGGVGSTRTISNQMGMHDQKCRS